MWLVPRGKGRLSMGPLRYLLPPQHHRTYSYTASSFYDHDTQGSVPFRGKGRGSEASMPYFTLPHPFLAPPIPGSSLHFEYIVAFLV